LAWIAADHKQAAAVVAAASRPWRERAAWIAALAVAVLSATLWVLGSGWRGTPVATEAQEMRLQIVTPPGAGLAGFAISPDRRALVYPATIEGRSQLWIRDLDSDTARPVDGTEGASKPFWDPDSRSIGARTSPAPLKRTKTSSETPPQIVTLRPASSIYDRQA
jgi:eukaryotic-like serine/threonine-protein kinase